jgi:hypothetical protein
MRASKIMHPNDDVGMKGQIGLTNEQEDQLWRFSKLSRTAVQKKTK